MTRVVGEANVGDSLRRLYFLQHRIYNLLGLGSEHRPVVILLTYLFLLCVCVCAYVFLLLLACVFYGPCCLK